MDSPSRDAVLTCLSTILTNDHAEESQTKGKLSESLVKWLDNETTTKVCGPTKQASASTMFSLLGWICSIFADLAKLRSSSGKSVAQEPAYWTPLLRSLAVCYDAFVASNAKTSVKRGGTVQVRRLFRGVGRREIMPLIPLAYETDR
jgi:hypothetical protein